MAAWVEICKEIGTTEVKRVAALWLRGLKFFLFGTTICPHYVAALWLRGLK